MIYIVKASFSPTGIRVKFIDIQVESQRLVECQDSRPITHNLTG